METNWDETRKIVWGQALIPIWSQLGSQVRDQFWGQAWDQIGWQVCGQVVDEINEIQDGN